MSPSDKSISSPFSEGNGAGVSGGARAEQPARSGGSWAALSPTARWGRFLPNPRFLCSTSARLSTGAGFSTGSGFSTSARLSTGVGFSTGSGFSTSAGFIPCPGRAFHCSPGGPAVCARVLTVSVAALQRVTRGLCRSGWQTSGSSPTVLLLLCRQNSQKCRTADVFVPACPRPGAGCAAAVALPAPEPLGRRVPPAAFAYTSPCNFECLGQGRQRGGFAVSLRVNL